MKRFFLSVFIIHYLLILPSSVGMADSTLLPRGPAGETILGLGTLSDAAYSPAGNYIATGGSLGVLLWESETGRLARVLYSGAQAVQCLAFTPGGDHLVAVGTEQTVLWDVESGRPLLSFPTKPMNPAVGISPDGQYVYIGNYDALTTQYMAEMWSLKTGTIVNQIGWSSGPFQSITVSPDTQYLLTTSGSSTQVWDIYSGALLVNYPYGGLGAKAIFSPDGNQVLIQSTDFSNAYLFNLFNTKELYVFSHKTKPDDISRDHYVFGAAFSPDGKQVVTISFNAIQVWDTATGILLRTLDGPLVTIRNDSSSNVSRIPPECYVISPRYDTFLCVDRALVNYTYSVSLWSLETGDRVRTIATYTPPVETAVFAPDGVHVCMGGGRSAQVWNITSGLVWQLYEDNLRGRIASVGYARDGRRLCIVDSMGTTQIRDTQTWQTLQTFRPLPGICASFSPDGTQLLTGGHGTIADYAYLWDIATGKMVRFFREGGMGNTGSAASTAQSIYPNWFNPAVFSPDGSKILTGCNSEFSKPEYNAARLWDTATGTLIRKFAKHTDSVVAAAYSADGRWIATGSRDHTAKLWEVETGRDIMTFTGHHGIVYGVKISPDGRYVLTSSDESRTGKPVILWDAVTGRELAVIQGHNGLVNAVDFSPDSRMILTAGDDGSARVWDLGAVLSRGSN